MTQCIKNIFPSRDLRFPCLSVSPTTRKVLGWGIAFFITLSALTLGFSFSSFCPLSLRRFLKIGGGVGIGLESVALGLLLRTSPQRRTQPIHLLPDPAENPFQTKLTGTGTEETSLTVSQIISPSPVKIDLFAPVPFQINAGPRPLEDNWDALVAPVLRANQEWKGRINVSFMHSSFSSEADTIGVSWSKDPPFSDTCYSFPVSITPQSRNDYTLTFRETFKDRNILPENGSYTKEAAQARIQNYLMGVEG